MKILVGMSGGVDSAYCAMKLKSLGHTVEGAFLILHGDSDLADASASAESIGIPFHIIDCRIDFERIVKDNFVNEYKNGRTPNPCVICNERVKLRKLLDYALQYGFDAIATGHYARIEQLDNGRYAVRSALDLKKDQSYMLSRLPQDILFHLVLPMSDEVKTEIRHRAADAGIPVARRKDSMEICFIEEGKYTDYIEERLGRFPEGDFVDSQGSVIGRHKGIIHYTVGQRKGLGVSLGSRAFVRSIDPVYHRIELCLSSEGQREITLADTVLMGIAKPTETARIRGEVKLRYSARSLGCEALITVNNGEVSKVRIITDEPVPFVTPGQSAVVYSDGVVLLSGFIEG